MKKTYKITSGEILKLMEDAEMYKNDELELYKAETGWQDWMENFTNAPEGEQFSQSEGELIDGILTEVFKFVHGGCKDDAVLDGRINNLIEKDKENGKIYF